MVKIGLIGAGFMGSMHAACYEALKEEGVRVAAVADLRADYAKKAAEKFGAEIYETGMELIEKADVEAVDICLPTYLHAAHVLAAMKAGKKVFVEKPVCRYPAEGEELLRVQRETGAAVMVGQCIRMWGEYVWLKKAVEDGTYGSMESAVFKRVSSKPDWAWEGWLAKPECSGGVALDMHVHDADYVRYLLGEPEELSAEAARDEAGVIQQIFATYRYGKAAVAVEAGWDYPAAFPFCMAFRIKFEKATVVFDSTADPSLVVYPKAGGKVIPELEKEYESENDIGGNVSSLGAYYSELKYFVEGLQGKHPLEAAPLDDAIKSVTLVLREIEAAGGLVLP